VGLAINILPRLASSPVAFSVVPISSSKLLLSALLLVIHSLSALARLILFDPEPSKGGFDSNFPESSYGVFRVDTECQIDIFEWRHERWKEDRRTAAAVQLVVFTSRDITLLCVFDKLEIFEFS
jgi:hypothetical protein